ncbi:sulfotransferase domain-containing protein [Cyanobium sp. Lug-B]|uniref:sulfotransferase domain-containing protein n=1 Tax=Cyanobium sp. Lug-B TaxID=2823716 RepID=UPI0020CCDA92|nr:sulfotransferase domain-containing protein [Cyanobium sp. Lug-B]MCP9798174.1 sulfotransferase domain-containing protein [Cyanobium sp. Lug-B]
MTDEDSLYSANLSNETPIPLLTTADYFAVCQIRDPLDLIVSQYFSHGWIHGLDPSIDAAIRNDIQAGTLSVYDYALMEFRGESGFGEVSILQKYRNLKRFSDALGEQCLILKYEDMVLNYKKWSRQISAFLKPFRSVQNVLDELKPSYKEFRRSASLLRFWSKQKFWDNPLDYAAKEMKHQHIRSPLPGDHLSFLTPNEITSLRTLVEEAQESQRA